MLLKDDVWFQDNFITFQDPKSRHARAYLNKLNRFWNNALGISLMIEIFIWIGTNSRYSKHTFILFLEISYMKMNQTEFAKSDEQICWLVQVCMW